jgi:hypothetical protein
MNNALPATITMDGVDLHLDPKTNRVIWASDWTRIRHLPLRRVSGGPGTFGHVDFYADGETREAFIARVGERDAREVFGL